MMRMRTVPVPGADLHVGVEGAGPVLLLCPADPRGMVGLSRMLVSEYTVVGYRRRHGSDTATPLATHAEDVHHLLAALTDRPAAIVGSSFGGLIALELVARHPGQVAQLVVHEPSLFDLLPAAERDAAVAAHQTVEQGFRDHGTNPTTMAALAEFMGLRYDDGWEPGVVQPTPDPQAVRAMARFFAEEASQAYLHHVDLDALRSSPTRIVAATGTSAQGHVPYRCAEALAAMVGSGPVRFPGAHLGSDSHPREFAATLSRVLRRKAPQLS